jgi:hypothetical protein
LEEIGERDGWRCWLCDEPVDPQMSVNDARGPSVDMRGAAPRGTKGKTAPSAFATERLAHRACHTGTGAVAAVIAWPEALFVSDPAPLMGVAERLTRKGGREVVGRCPTRADAQATADWLTDRFSRLVPELGAQATVEPGGGQFLVALTAERRR